MPWQWISRILNRDQLIGNQHEKMPNVSYSSTKDPKQIGLDESAESPVNELSQVLETAFFCWLLDCDNSDLQIDSQQRQHKVQTILKALDQDALSLDKIPRRPSSFPLLIKLLNSDNTSNKEIADALLADPALATQTLKTANSPFFRTSSETIESVDRAVFMLGSQGIRNIISATVMMPMIKGNNSQEAVFSKKVWQWGLLSATASDQYSYLQGDTAGPIYLLGLLPALTYLLIYQSLQSYQNTHPSSNEIEPSVIRTVIQERSWRLCHDICQQWGLPPSSNKYLLDAERPSPATPNTPLRDGIFIGTHKVLQASSRSPIGDQQAFLLSGASNRVNRKVIQYLSERVN